MLESKAGGKGSPIVLRWVLREKLYVEMDRLRREQEKRKERESKGLFREFGSVGLS